MRRLLLWLVLLVIAPLSAFQLVTTTIINDGNLCHMPLFRASHRRSIGRRPRRPRFLLPATRQTEEAESAADVPDRDDDATTRIMEKNPILRGIPNSSQKRRSRSRENRTWMDSYALLIEYQQIHGDTRVPPRYPTNPSFGKWVSDQRTRYQKGNLTLEQQTLLDRIGFDWENVQERNDRLWQEQFEAIKSLCGDTEGGSQITLAMLQVDPSLYHWAQRQRLLKKNDRLRRDREDQLTSIGFLWVERDYPDSGEINTETYDLKWDANFAKLQTFKAQWGHVIVPSVYAEDPALGLWVVNQRVMFRRGQLRSDRLDQLNAIGFVFDLLENNNSTEQSLRERLWEKMFQQLAVYQDKHGQNAKVVDDPELQAWVDSQRVLQRMGKLRLDRKQRLESLGLRWAAKRELVTWDVSFGQLQDFHAEHGTCHVPLSKLPKLSQWTRTQRYARRNGKLSPDQIKKLDALGFVWKDGERWGVKRRFLPWDVSFGQLQDFQAKHGTCHVPFSKQPKLYQWTGTQRYARKKGKLSPDQIKKLDALGFVWNLGD